MQRKDEKTRTQSQTLPVLGSGPERVCNKWVESDEPRCCNELDQDPVNKEVKSKTYSKENKVLKKNLYVLNGLSYIK